MILWKYVQVILLLFIHQWIFKVKLEDPCAHGFPYKRACRDTGFTKNYPTPEKLNSHRIVTKDEGNGFKNKRGPLLRAQRMKNQKRRSFRCYFYLLNPPCILNLLSSGSYGRDARIMILLFISVAIPKREERGERLKT